MECAGLHLVRYPRRSVILAIPLWRPVVLTQLVADVLNAADDRKHLAVRATALRPKLSGKLLPSRKHQLMIRQVRRLQPMAHSLRVCSPYRAQLIHSESLDRDQQRNNPGWVIRQRQQRVWAKMGRERRPAPACGCLARHGRRDRAGRSVIATCCQNWRMDEKSRRG